MTEVDEAGSPGKWGALDLPHFLPGSRREGVLASQLHNPDSAVVI